MHITTLLFHFSLAILKVSCQTANNNINRYAYDIYSKGECREYGIGMPPECTEGFPTLYHIDVVQEKAILRYRDRVQAIYPTITFGCNGNITKWIIGADWGGYDLSYTELQIWRRRESMGNENNIIYDKVGGTRLIFDGPKSTQIYEYDVNPPLEFKEGDIFGYFQPEDERCQVDIEVEDSGRTLRVYDRIRSDIYEAPLETFYLFNNHYTTREHPLITVKTEPPGCGCNFMSIERMNALLDNIVLVPNPGPTSTITSAQIVFPDLKFLCSGRVDHFIVGGEFEPNYGFHAEIQIWRPIGESTYVKQSGSKYVVFSSNSDDMYALTTDPPLYFESGDILGLFQPASFLTQLTINFDSLGNSTIFYVPLDSSQTVSSVESIDITTAGVLSHSGLPLVSVVVNTNVVAPGSGSGDDENLLSPDTDEESDNDQDIEPDSTSNEDDDELLILPFPSESITHESAMFSSSYGVIVTNTPRQVDVTTDSGSTSSNDSSNGLTLYLVLGVMCVIIALVIALVAIILIVIVMLFFVRKRKKGESYTINKHNSESNTSMTGNQVYNEHTNTVCHHNNRPPINPPYNDNAERVYEDLEEYESIRDGNNGSGLVMNAACASSDRVDNDHNDIPTPINPAYSIQQLETMSLDNIEDRNGNQEEVDPSTEPYDYPIEFDGHSLSDSSSGATINSVFIGEEPTALDAEDKDKSITIPITFIKNDPTESSGSAEVVEDKDGGYCFFAPMKHV